MIERIVHTTGSDPMQALGTATLLMRQGGDLPYLQAQHMWDIGVLLQPYSDKTLLSQMAESMGVATTLLRDARHVVSKYRGDKEKFLAEFKASGAKSFTWFVTKVLNKAKRAKQKPVVSDMDLYYSIIRTIREYKDSKNPDILHTLSKIQDAIGRGIPPTGPLLDRNYVKFYNCVCCDEQAPEDGHNLVTMPDLHGVRLPVCETCKEENNPPNLAKATIMYAKYAYDVERAYNRINVSEN